MKTMRFRTALMAVRCALILIIIDLLLIVYASLNGHGQSAFNNVLVFHFFSHMKNEVTLTYPFEFRFSLSVLRSTLTISLFIDHKGIIKSRCLLILRCIFILKHEQELKSDAG